MATNVEHIGIAVKEMEAANRLYTQVLGAPPYKEEVVPSEGVLTSFFRVNETKIELLQALDVSSPVYRFIEKRGEGIHHIAYEVEDIRAEMARLREEGFHLLAEEPKQGADNKLVCFVHPRSANGVLTELCQERR
jgi:methylmalonyl-CoA/ethylmalonyl-CoA epimerase